MMPIWARYGPFFLYGFNVLLGLGIVMALGVTARLARGKRDLDGWWDGALAAAVGALIGGRIAFVWLNRAYFAERPVETWQVWQGGLGYHGALLGGLLALWVWAKSSDRSFIRYAGLMTPGMALLLAFGWAACWVEGCAYGAAASSGWMSADLPDDMGVYALRYPTQILGLMGSLVAGLCLSACPQFVAPRRRLWFALGALSLVHGTVGLLRGDQAPLISGLRADVWLDVGLTLLSLGVLLLRRSRDEALEEHLQEGERS